MPEAHKSALRLSDLMILVAFAAGSLVLYRPLLPVLQAQLNDPVPLKPTLRFYYLSVAAFPLIAALTFAVPVLRLRRPLPHLRHLSREPGVVACIAAGSSLLFLAIWVTLIWLTPRNPTFTTWPIMICIQVWERVGFAVAGVWLSFGITGRSRRNSDWIDRLGILLGFAWLLAPLWTIVLQIPWF